MRAPQHQHMRIFGDGQPVHPRTFDLCTNCNRTMRPQAAYCPWCGYPNSGTAAGRAMIARGECGNLIPETTDSFSVPQPA